MLAEKSLLEKLGLKQQEEPREVVRKCQRMIRTEIRGVERQMMEVQREQKKAEKLIKDAAKRNDLVSAKVPGYAKQLSSLCLLFCPRCCCALCWRRHMPAF
jgi:charged multivesicular body protein 3